MVLKLKAQIIAVGTELLLGDILNTNAQYLSKQLALLGIDVHFQSVVGDNAYRLKNVVENALKNCDLLVFSGGLGPTEDDLTKQTVCDAFGDTLSLDKEELDKIEKFFAKWGRTMPDNNIKQAMLPTKGRKIINNNGTAPGAIFENNGKYAVLLPGPPRELQLMFENEVKPWLLKLSDNVMHSTVLRVSGIGESHLEPIIKHLLLESNPTAALYAKPGEVVIRITAKAKTKQKAVEMCDVTAQKFYDIIGEHIYARDVLCMEELIVKELSKRKKTLAIAESCTGGLLSQRITEIAGASEVFGYGVVTYSNEAKMNLLSVKNETLQEYGAVSAQTAAQMAQGVRRLANADIGIAITGIAGPGGGTPEKPVGTVFVAACDENYIYIQKIAVTNRTRESVRLFTVQYALDIIRRMAIETQQPLCQKFKINSEIIFVEENKKDL